MLILSLTTDKIQVITNGTTSIDVLTSFIDRNQSTGTVGLADRELHTISAGAPTTTDIVAVPGATTTRNVKTIHIRNKHASANTDVTVQFNANGTLYELHKVTLAAGECLEYVEGVGFYTITNSTRFDRSMYVTSDSVHATAATFADITGLQCPMLSGVLYNFQAMLFHISNATTTGAQFGVNIGAVPTALSVSTIDTVTGAAGAATLSAGTVTARDTAITAQTTGSATITMAIIAGFIQPSADGTFSMRATSEVTVSSGLTVKKGSWLRVWRPSNV